ncbi:hypothetical protein PR001_g20514 [Phytophthora rubi]|uniref:Integrase catalytic domain-containing protein n=1 Tax=Phytophthora rubi TaxID=129364 RepID=A0A6A3JNL8_9STRA|nr:hypothetical protein PR001_g20514 [Phytophthora rubi]
MKKWRMSYRNMTGSRDEHPISTIHMDTNGSMETIGVYGSCGKIKYFLSIIDDNTSWRWTYVLRSKKEVFEKVEELLLQLEREGKFTIRRVRSDGGTEFVNAAFKSFCKSKGIVFQTSNAYSPEENGAAERDHQSKLDRNRTPMARLRNKTPYEMVYGTPPNVSKLPVWGAVCFAHVPAALRRDKKLSARALKCRFLGISEETKGYRLWDMYNNKHIISRDVLFDTTNVANMVERAFGKTESALTIESAARESPAAEGAPTLANESTEAVGAETLANASAEAVGAETPAQESTKPVGAEEPTEASNPAVGA